MPSLDADLMLRLADAVSQVRPGHTLLAAEHMVGGISATMLRLDVETPSGGRARWVGRMPGDWSFAHNPRGAETMAALLEGLHASRIPCPMPIGIEAHDRPFLFLEYIEGSPLVQSSDWPAVGRAVAEALAAIHATPLRDAVPLRSVPSRRERPETGIADLREDDVWDALRELEPRGTGLVHGDFWPGNMIWREGALVGVVDWEEAHLGDPLHDVGIARLDLLWVGGWAAVEAFTQRYFECAGSDAADLCQYDLRAALRPMGYLDAWASAFPGLGRPDITEAHMREALLEFIERALQQANR